jgi:hypothetical protein
VRGDPVWYTLVDEKDGDSGALYFSADKKIVVIQIDDVFLEDESLKVKRSE